MVSFCKNGRFRWTRQLILYQTKVFIIYSVCTCFFSYLSAILLFQPFFPHYIIFLCNSSVLIKVNYSILSTLPNIVYYFLCVWGCFDNICVWVLLSSPNMHREKSLWLTLPAYVDWPLSVVELKTVCPWLERCCLWLCNIFIVFVRLLLVFFDWMLNWLHSDCELLHDLFCMYYYHKF